MKKIILCLLVVTFGIACNNHGTISEAKLKKALDITYQELSKADDAVYQHVGYGIGFSFLAIKRYLADKNYLKGIQCTILEKSNVNGTIYNRACLLKNVNKQEEGSSSSPDVLVVAYEDYGSKNKIVLRFFQNAKRIETGEYSYNSWLPYEATVNLETHKISISSLAM